jgi:Ca-activated chloride channel family protein
VWNDVPAQPIDGGIMLELGDLWSGEERKLVLTFDVPAKPQLGLAEIARLELRYVAVPSFAEQTVTIPVHVNVVPGDQAAGRIADPKVRDELVYQQVQDAKRKASDALLAGDDATAATFYADAAAQVGALPAASPELAREALILSDLHDRAQAGDAAWASKFGVMDAARKSRTRGREA